MSGILSNLDWHKVMIVLGATAAVVLLMTILLNFVIFPHPNPAQQTAMQTAPSPTAIPIKHYTTAQFSIDAPSNWDAKQSAVAGGGTNTTFTIPGATFQSQTEGIMSIQGTPVTQTSVSQVMGVFAALGYTRSQKTIDNISASKFSGNVDDLREVAYVFQKGTTVYLIKLSYTAKQAEKGLEDQFNKAVNSLTFN